MTNKVFKKCKKAWSDNSLRVIRIELYYNYKTIRYDIKTIYNNIIELISWDDDSITFRYRGYHNYTGVIKVKRKFIKYIKLFNDNTFNGYYTRRRY